MNRDYFLSSPSYGMINPMESKRFNDMKLFIGKSYLFTKLKKIKVWFGTPSDKSKQNNKKAILGIETEYKLIKGKSKRHLGSITSNDVVTAEVKLKDSTDFFTKLYLCVEDVITFIKFMTKKGNVLEIGHCDKNTMKEISLNNDQDPSIIQTLHGYYDDTGLRALGARYIQAKRFYFINNMDILGIRYKYQKDKKFREKWENEENINKLDNSMKAIIKLAVLPNNTFGVIFKYMME